MPACFVCHGIFETLNTLVLHCKLKHKLDENSVYRCRESQCFRDFPNLKTFKRHIKSKHKIIHNMNTFASINLSENSIFIKKIITGDTNKINVPQNNDVATTLSDLELFKKMLKHQTLVFLGNYNIYNIIVIHYCQEMCRVL